MNPHLLSEHDHKIILDKIEAGENLNHDEYVEDKNYYNVDIDGYYIFRWTGNAYTLQEKYTCHAFDPPI